MRKDVCLNCACVARLHRYMSNAAGDIVLSFLWYLGEGVLREILNDDCIK